ncbi:MAG: hypothetical protein A3D34_01415 [Candidatus Staskawiczbacteria bacterium RIFCSPHIGHO2_02_FULL_33_16]|uniref:HTH iclR-type domain-containing protein n=1 Tax=Candidatus Staskawiczbacteria bacterium RIFCSPHIGHO2_02_FULL_33_16 TaxID=1802204 RepID=A0A1G2HV58_9BACT|nr:MAG: hypothetical protein A3D34_01415 [Candidatus Staskawiczbacteria bacterium RIFCSPHIGHO2_02_FULL_33_16]
MQRMAKNYKTDYTKEEIIRIVKELEKKGEKIWLGKIAREMGLGRTERSPLRYHILRLAEQGVLKVKKEPAEFQKELLVVKSK